MTRVTRLGWWQTHFGGVRIAAIRRPLLLKCLGYLERGAARTATPPGCLARKEANQVSMASSFYDPLGRTEEGENGQEKVENQRDHYRIVIHVYK